MIVAMCADLTRGRGRFNALQGLIATALSVGGVIGLPAAGFLVQHLGFAMAFDAFALVAAVAAGLFLGWMPETRASSVRRFWVVGREGRAILVAGSAEGTVVTESRLTRLKAWSQFREQTVCSS